MKRLNFIIKDTFRMKQSFLLLFSIVFSFLMPILIFTFSSFFMKNAQEQSYQLYGYFDNILYKASEEFPSLRYENDSSTLENYKAYVEKVGTITTIQQLDTDANTDTLSIGYADQNAIDLGYIQLLDGRYPTKKGEIALCNSIIYKQKLDRTIGSHIQYNGKDYTLVGILNDYSAVWNRPSADEKVIFPNAFISLEEANSFEAIMERHLLFKNSNYFPNSWYESNYNLVSNTNQLSNNDSNKYSIPSSIIILTSICAFLLNFYIFSYYIGSMQKKVAILRCLSMTKTESIFYVLKKIMLLLVVAIPLSLFLSFVLSHGILTLFRHQLDMSGAIELPIDYVLLSFGITIATVILSSVFMVLKIRKLSPMALFREQEQAHIGYHITFGKKTRRFGIPKLAWNHFKTHLHKMLLVILLIASTMVLFHTLIIYMNQYASAKLDVAGRMALDFDYEFLTDQTISDTSYINDNGETVQVYSLPDENSVFSLPDYTKIISQDTINELRNHTDVKSVNEYLEVNDLYLCNAPDPMSYPYLTEGFLDDIELSEEIASKFNINSSTRSIQFFGFSKEQLEDMLTHVESGEINIDKILSGEELILMAPAYERRAFEDGSVSTYFLTKEEYSGKQNQFKDTYFSVGDTIEFVQITPNDTSLKGYINQEQLDSSLQCKTFSTKIGAIIPERINWFETLSQPPTAYTLVGLNETIEAMGMLPTTSRIQIYLNDTVSYEEFDPVIQEYEDQLQGFFFLNNAAELAEFKEFKLFLESICYSLIGIVGLVTIFIVFIEERIQLIHSKRYYALLHLIGVHHGRMSKLILLQSLYSGIIGILVSVPATILAIQIFYGDWIEMLGFRIFLSSYHDIRLIFLSFISIFVVFLVSTLFSIRYLKRNESSQLLQS